MWRLRVQSDRQWLFSQKRRSAGRSRLAQAINRTAELFEQANDKLAERLAVDELEDRPAIEDKRANGRAKVKI